MGNNFGRWTQGNYLSWQPWICLKTQINSVEQLKDLKVCVWVFQIFNSSSFVFVAFGPERKRSIVPFLTVLSVNIWVQRVSKSDGLTDATIIPCCIKLLVHINRCRMVELHLTMQSSNSSRKSEDYSRKKKKTGPWVWMFSLCSGDMCTWVTPKRVR